MNRDRANPKIVFISSLAPGTPTTWLLETSRPNIPEPRDRYPGSPR